MDYIKYNIHDLLSVSISKKLYPEVIDEIKFQIDSFSKICKINGKSKKTIFINPLSFFSKKGKISSFYNFEAKESSYIENSDKSLIIELVDNNYYIYSNLANYLINIFIQILLVESECTLCHGSACQNPLTGEVILFTGAGGVGKTAILNYVVRELGFKHFGDDLVILTKEGECLSFPRKFVIKSYHQEQMHDLFKKFNLNIKNSYKFKKFLVENLPFMGLLKKYLRNSRFYHLLGKLIRPINYVSTISSDQLFGDGAIAIRGRVAKVIFLERMYVEKFSYKEVDAKLISGRMAAVLHYEFKEFYSTFISMACMYLFDMNDYFFGIRNIFNKFTSSCQNYHLAIPFESSPASLIKALNDNKVFK